ncbi:MAG: HtaA domain-containing protein [Pseudonocardia sp.]|nr:HtaA domain-containing protein [Pseudonocardia sp.]
MELLPASRRDGTVVISRQQSASSTTGRSSMSRPLARLSAVVLIAGCAFATTTLPAAATPNVSVPASSTSITSQSTAIQSTGTGTVVLSDDTRRNENFIGVFTTFGGGVENVIVDTLDGDPYRFAVLSGEFPVSRSTYDSDTERGTIPLTGTLKFSQGTSQGRIEAEFASLRLDLRDPSNPRVTGRIVSTNVNIPDPAPRVTLFTTDAVSQTIAADGTVSLAPAELRFTATAADYVATVFFATGPRFAEGDVLGTLQVTFD